MASSSRVNIKGLDKLELLHQLWINAPNASILNQIGFQYAWDESEAKEELASGGRIDYCLGRNIKVSIHDDEVDPTQYDKTAGQGALKRVVESMRGKPIPAEEAELVGKFHCDRCGAEADFPDLNEYLICGTCRRR